MNQLSQGVIADIPVFSFVQTLLIAILYAFILSFTVKKFSRILGDKSQYAVIFPILIPVMVLIISVIKNSLALSLGLVGALSIVRFRTPIKEPEELTYLFIAIAVGLGLGANQFTATSICFFVVIFTLMVQGFFRGSRDPQGVFLDIDSAPNPNSNNLSLYSNLLRENKMSFNIRRYQEDGDRISATYYIEPKNLDALEELLNKIKQTDNNAKFNVINKVQDVF